MSDAPDEIVPAELADAPPELPQPPLSIGHLFLWILGSALVLASYRWLAEPGEDRVWRLLFHLDHIMRGLTGGAGVAAIMLLVRRLVIRDAPLPRQPGHWLLLLQGVSWPTYWLLLWWIYGFRGAPAADPRGWEFFQRYAVGSSLYYAWGAVVYVSAAVLLRDAPRWRMLFVLSATLTLLHSVLWCCMMSTAQMWYAEKVFVLLRLAIGLAMLAICVLRDRSAAISRDWMHAAGVGIFTLGSLWYVAVFLLSLLLPR